MGPLSEILSIKNRISKKILLTECITEVVRIRLLLKMKVFTVGNHAWTVRLETD